MMTYIEAIEELSEARKQVSRMEDEVQRLGVELVNKALGTTHEVDALELGSWDCLKSPTESCAYNVDADPNCDDCLFCHQPHERK